MNEIFDLISHDSCCSSFFLPVNPGNLRYPLRTNDHGPLPPDQVELKLPHRRVTIGIALKQQTPPRGGGLEPQ